MITYFKPTTTEYKGTEIEIWTIVDVDYVDVTGVMKLLRTKNPEINRFQVQSSISEDRMTCHPEQMQTGPGHTRLKNLVRLESAMAYLAKYRPHGTKGNGERRWLVKGASEEVIGAIKDLIAEHYFEHGIEIIDWTEANREAAERQRNKKRAKAEEALQATLHKDK